ncbi:MAG: preprotein translocase subunit SecG [Candidatus Andersenbacteria bacterium]|nr:preprotein translocase subunit SecG [bacterium]MDZ4225351.1 preprotein translocase subunit SecG [Candidatus Andersenbacteria bacterium]
MLWLDITTILSAVGLTTAILLQSRSAGLGGAFGGGEGFHIRRGSEKKLWQITIVLSVVFLVSVAAHLFLR